MRLDTSFVKFKKTKLAFFGPKKDNTSVSSLNQVEGMLKVYRHNTKRRYKKYPSKGLCLEIFLPPKSLFCQEDSLKVLVNIVLMLIRGLGIMNLSLAIVHVIEKTGLDRIRSSLDRLQARICNRLRGKTHKKVSIVDRFYTLIIIDSHRRPPSILRRAVTFCVLNGGINLQSNPCVQP